MERKSEIHSSPLNVAHDRQPSGQEGFGGSRPNVRSDVRRRDLEGSEHGGPFGVGNGWLKWQETAHVFVGAPSDPGYTLCRACNLPRVHGVHKPEQLESLKPELSIGDRRLTCPACNQVVKADDEGMLAYHEVGVPCPLPKAIDKPCVRCVNGYAGGVHLDPCQGSYTKGHPHRMLPEAVEVQSSTSQIRRGFSYIEIEEAPTLSAEFVSEFRQMGMQLHGNHSNVGQVGRLKEWSECAYARLRELASDPDKSTKEIFEELGFNNYSSWDYNLKKDPEAKRIFDEGREAATGAPRQARSESPAPKRRQAKGTNGNGHGKLSDELLRKIKHEFEHVTLYQQVSEFFDEVAEQVARL